MEPLLTVIEAYDRLLSRERFAEAGDLLRREIEPRIVLNEDISRRKAEPLTQLTDELGTSLGSVGIVQPDGLSDTGWCSKGFLYAWN